jgi:hypothetical protein
MYVSKKNLSVVAMTKQDKNIPQLNNVHLAADGSTVGASGRSTMVVSPVQNEIRKRLESILEDSGMSEMTISAETINEVMKAIPADKTFKGMLEHCDVKKLSDREVKFTIYTQKRKKVIMGQLFPRSYIHWKEVIQEACASKVVNRVVLNVGRLITLLQVAEKIIGDSSGENAVFLEFTEDNDVIVRGRDATSGQRLIGVMSSYVNKEEQWLRMDQWERNITGRQAKKVRKKKVRRRVK